jgi:hypothetical protein
VKLLVLAAEYLTIRAAGGLVLIQAEVTDCAIRAARHYAAYGNLRSISLSDALPEAPAPGATAIPAAADPEPTVVESLPVKNLTYITDQTEVSVGEWSSIQPLFTLYVEKENAMRLEASRSMGIEVYGRSVGEIAQDISREEEAMPQKAFSHAVLTVE